MVPLSPPLHGPAPGPGVVSGVPVGLRRHPLPPIDNPRRGIQAIMGPAGDGLPVRQVTEGGDEYAATERHQPQGAALDPRPLGDQPQEGFLTDRLYESVVRSDDRCGGEGVVSKCRYWWTPLREIRKPTCNYYMSLGL